MYHFVSVIEVNNEVCMPSINIRFDEKDFALLKSKKGRGRSWHRFIMELSR